VLKESQEAGEDRGGQRRTGEGRIGERGRQKRGGIYSGPDILEDFSVLQELRSLLGVTPLPV
jgi:hypothetical protein